MKCFLCGEEEAGPACEYSMVGFVGGTLTLCVLIIAFIWSLPRWL
jgi:hypothetical protein